MSFAGLEQFHERLEALMASDAFRDADEGTRLHMGWAIVRAPTGPSLWSCLRSLWQRARAP